MSENIIFIDLMHSILFNTTDLFDIMYLLLLSYHQFLTTLLGTDDYTQWLSIHTGKFLNEDFLSYSLSTAIWKMFHTKLDLIIIYSSTIYSFILYSKQASVSQHSLSFMLQPTTALHLSDGYYYCLWCVFI